ncbi:hypothetical protein SLEP1_g52183 [Rubroshorea leprosula]|uniref:Uncharacterized protein n=1 Tax=Rubroshorea leprosula TaxID=152421 RepID=A0AAV5M6D2_9ROSI|nr:hypothetical protein SLEP1_g52183 [Rubroshorea leprosula]
MLDEHGLDIGSERFAELVGAAGNKKVIASDLVKGILLFGLQGSFKVIILYCGRGRQIQERANISVIFNGLESSNCTCCARGTTLQIRVIPTYMLLHR